LEGLEVSEVMLSGVLKDNENKRIDSEYFKKEFLNFFNNVPNLRPLEYFVKCGYRVVYENTTIIDAEEGKANNYPYFLQATDLETPFIKTDNLFYVNDADWKRYPKGRIKKGEILIEVKGKIEKVNENISKHVLLCYLISKYGVTFKNRYKTNLLISYISKPDLYRIPIPEFSKYFQKKVDDKFELIFRYQKQSQILYHQAEELLLETIGLKDFKPSQTGINIKSFKESFLATGRLDAEYYQSKYEKIENKIKTFQHGYSLIKEHFKQNKQIVDRSKKQYYYTEIGDINIGNGSFAYNLINIDDLPDNAKIKSEKNDVLISKVRPNRGAVAIINEDIQDFIVSGAFIVLKENSDYKKETLFVLLKNNVYKEWLLKYNMGTSYPVIKDDDILNLPIPMIEGKIQQQISELIEKSFYLCEESKRLLDEAKDMVEREIEK
jgi:restriction endonuclease S subunit